MARLNGARSSASLHTGHMRVRDAYGSNVCGATYCDAMHPRATVDRALRLSAQGLVDREVAQITGVSIGAVQKWRTGRRRTREKELRHSNCPRCDGAPLDEPAYAYLLGLYLGDGHITRHRRGV